jgi:hypothetical protein
MLLGLTILMIIALAGCEPEWCDEKWTEFMNFDYGYTVKYPTSCSLTYSDFEYSHDLHIFFRDGWTQLSVTVYSSLDSYSIESLYYTFKDGILAATKDGDDVDFVKRYDYEILRSWEGEEFFPEIHYAFTEAQVDLESGNWEETDMVGETWWCMGSHMDTEYIYSCTYETLAGCEKCIWVCDELSFDLYHTVSQ